MSEANRPAQSKDPCTLSRPRRLQWVPEEGVDFWRYNAIQARRMTSVHISPEIDSRKRRLSRTLFLTAFGVVAFVLIDWVILRRQIDPIDLAAFGVFFAVWAFWSDKPTPSFDLEMDSDEIRMVEDGSVKRTVSKDRICYVREWSGNIFRKPVIVISERNAVGTRLLGGIAVPKNIPECEQIKTQALSWLENSKT